jgi:hypothetical protein
MKTYLLHDFVGNPPNDYVIFNEPDSRWPGSFYT